MVFELDKLKIEEQIKNDDSLEHEIAIKIINFY